MYRYPEIKKLLSLFVIFCYAEKTDAYYNDALDPVNEELDTWHQPRYRIARRNYEDLGCERPDMYICEEPPDLVPPEQGKVCDYRNVRYHEQIYRWVAGRGCLLYTPEFLYNAGSNPINLNSGCFYGNLYAPCLEIAKEDGTCGCYPFDPGLEKVAEVVRDAITPSAHGRWERCFYQASECCRDYMGDENTIDTSECAATFDGWTCWQSAYSDTTASEVCSEFAYSNSGPTCHHYSSKQCYSNGTWKLQTDYTSCSITPRLIRRYRFHIIVMAVSIVLCLPAIIVFFFYKRLRITRVALHRNLLIAIVVRNVLVIISRSTVYIDELTTSGDTVMATHSIPCRMLAIAERIAVNAVFVCMLVEAVYLHRLIAAVFRQKLKIKWLYGCGIGIAIVPVIAWSVVMGVHNDHSCWLVYTVDHIQWILDAPRCAILLINTILFTDVVRILLTKVRNSENTNQLNTAKASLFLMPLFGIQFFLTAFRPPTTNCVGEQIYFYIAYSLEGLQGFIVALLYCYINKEVLTLVKATYKKTENAVVSIVSTRRDSSYPRMNIDPSSNRRMTYSTAVPDDEQDKDHPTMSPKLHVAEIISIQATERLAEILDPIYETIEIGIVNGGYDEANRSATSDVESNYVRNNLKVDDYYGFTIASSVSIDCHDWIRGVSPPPNSSYNNSLNDYDVKFLERKMLKLQNINEASGGAAMSNELDSTHEEMKAATKEGDVETLFEKQIDNDLEDTEYEDAYEDSADNESNVDSEFMIEAILEYMESDNNDGVVLNPMLLSPNRNKNDKIIFLVD